MRGKEFRARDKKVQKLTRDGLVERNQATGEESRISQRTADISFGPERTQEQALKRPEASRARNKQKRKQQAKKISAKIRAEMSLTEAASDLTTQMQTGLAESENTESIIASENLSDNAEFDSPPVMRDARDIPLRYSGNAGGRKSRRRQRRRQRNKKAEKSDSQEPLQKGRLRFRETGLSDDKTISEKYRNLREEARKESDSEAEEIPQDGRLQFDHKRDERAEPKPSRAKKRQPVKHFDGKSQSEGHLHSKEERLQFDHAPPAETDKLSVQKRQQAKRVLYAKKEENTEAQELQEAPEKGHLQFEHAPPIESEPPVKPRQSRRSVQQHQPEHRPPSQKRLRFEDESPPIKDDPQALQRRRPAQPHEGTVKPKNAETSDTIQYEKPRRLRFEDEPQPTKDDQQTLQKRRPAQLTEGVEKPEDAEASDTAQQEPPQNEPPKQGRLNFEDAGKAEDPAEGGFASRRQKKK